jgi:hypothetical protein
MSKSHIFQLKSSHPTLSELKKHNQFALGLLLWHTRYIHDLSRMYVWFVTINHDRYPWTELGPKIWRCWPTEPQNVLRRSIKTGSLMFLDSLLSILGSPLYIVEIHHDPQDSIIIKLCVREKNHAPKSLRPYQGLSEWREKLSTKSWIADRALDWKELIGCRVLNRVRWVLTPQENINKHYP